VNRDTQFAGFAKALYNEVQNKVVGMSLEDWTPTYSAKVAQDIIAQRAYDLVKHTLSMVPHLLAVAEQSKTIEEVIAYVPDPMKSEEVSV